MDTFVFNEERHEYRLNGIRIPSLSDILRPFQNSYVEIPDQEIVERAREKGVHAHKLTELYDLGEIDEFEDVHVSAWKDFLWWTGFKPTHIEHRTYTAEYGYGCTIDRLGVIPSGEQVLLDIKTGSPAPWHPWQLAGQIEPLVEHELCPRDIIRGNLYLLPKRANRLWTWEPKSNDEDFKIFHEARRKYFKEFE